MVSVQSKEEETVGVIMKLCMANITSLTSDPITMEDYHSMAVRIFKQDP